MAIVFSATVNNISVISWESVFFLDEEIWENYRPVASHWQTLSYSCIVFAVII